MDKTLILINFNLIVLYSFCFILISDFESKLYKWIYDKVFIISKYGLNVIYKTYMKEVDE